MASWRCGSSANRNQKYIHERKKLFKVKGCELADPWDAFNVLGKSFQFQPQKRMMSRWDLNLERVEISPTNPLFLTQYYSFSIFTKVIAVTIVMARKM